MRESFKQLQVYVCNALWDSPQYTTLSTLLDRPSPLLPNNEGIFDRVFRELENITIDVSVKEILRYLKNFMFIKYRLISINNNNRHTHTICMFPK